MPIIKSAKKALRQNKRRRARNIAKLDAVRLLRRSILKLVAAQKSKEAQEKLGLFYKALDKAAKTGVIKKNTARRRKSRMTKFVAAALKH
jgi:small subunit ribosomal protein S20